MNKRSYQKHLYILTIALLLVWAVVSFVLPYFARDMSFRFMGWPLSYWLAAQGSLLIYGAIIGYYAYRMNRLDAHQPQHTQLMGFSFGLAVNKIFKRFLIGFILFVAALAVLEQLALPRLWIGYIFLFATVGLYASIGILCRTSDASEYYVAGRRVPAFYNGMATGADWMSAASFIGLAGTLYLSGYNGLAYVMGWVGGFCLIALLLAPFLRRFGQYTVPDFLSARYGGNGVRLIGVMATMLCSFVYVVAQIYGVGLITSRLLGVAFELGIFLGLGGILVCSFLGGMRAVTWTQVSQYVILIVAFLLPVVWLSVKQTGIPLPQFVYGYQLEKLSVKEQALLNDPKELQVRQLYQERSQALNKQLEQPSQTYKEQRDYLEKTLTQHKVQNHSSADIGIAERNLLEFPRNENQAQILWQKELTQTQSKIAPLNAMPVHTQTFEGNPAGNAQEQLSFENSRRNFLALVFCLMLGTAGLPHILVRYYTTPSVIQTRKSVTWSWFFVVLLYLTAPALAVLVKFEIFHTLVGSPIAELPGWVAAWSKVDASLVSVQDVNADGILQLNELTLGGDVIALATAEVAGLPYVISGLVAAGGLAAALSTADGLLLTMANSLSHDVYFKIFDRSAPTIRRVTLSKILLLLVALAAAYVAAQKPANILFMVTAAFSLAAAAFVPALVMGIFWKRTSAWGAMLGMLAGLGICIYYMVLNQPWLRQVFGVQLMPQLWWEIQPLSAGVFGVPVGFAVIALVSLLGSKPNKQTREWVDRIQTPEGWELPKHSGH